MMRLEVGTKEDPSIFNRNVSMSNLDPRRFDTLRYQYKNRFGIKEVGNGIGKAFLDVGKIDFPYDPAELSCNDDVSASTSKDC